MSYFSIDPDVFDEFEAEALGIGDWLYHFKFRSLRPSVIGIPAP